MKSQLDSLTEIIKELDPTHQQELLDFAEFLLQKHKPRNRTKPTFSWAGGLKDLREQFTSVELQHDIVRQMSDES